MKLCFNNFAGPEWDSLLDEKASIILATVASSLPKGHCLPGSCEQHQRQKSRLPLPGDDSCG